MKKIFLVSCAKTKRDNASVAEELYVSTLFQEAKKLASAGSDRWFILSAEHGLLDPKKVIDPYEKTLKRMTKEERRSWAALVLNTLRKKLEKKDQVVFLAGKEYREEIGRVLTKQGIQVVAPLQSMGLGKQMSWLIKVNKNPQRVNDLNSFYEILGNLKVGVPLKKVAECDGKFGWPQRGVYLFFSPKENRAFSPDVARVVRVGTHAVSNGSKSTLWNRLKTHKGSIEGGGNHRSSVFRLHVGNALINRYHLETKYPDWGKGESASERIREHEVKLEKMVSEEIGEMSLTYLRIEDEPSSSSDRSYIERNMIALLSGPEGPIDVPATGWLGNYSTHTSVRKSGLWNVRHIDEFYDKNFLAVFREYVRITVGGLVAPRSSLAPKGWEDRIERGTKSDQLTLFAAGDADGSSEN